jgi:hypothetical protein
MKIKFLEAAEKEFEDVVIYYNQQSDGLGYEFAAEVRRTIKRIDEYIEAWAPLSERTRRCRTNRFPYGIIYQARVDIILIVSVMHIHKHPDSWKSTIKEK